MAVNNLAGNMESLFNEEIKGQEGVTLSLEKQESATIIKLFFMLMHLLNSTTSLFQLECAAIYLQSDG